MATPVELAALRASFLAATAAGVLFPAAEACEGAVESTWFTSQLYREDNNVFGMKQHVHPIYGSVSIPTREFLNERWITVDAAWVKYPTLQACFADRMATLRGLAPHYPHYAAALAATTPEEFLTQVSLSWSTGPARGATCAAILHEHATVFAAPAAAGG